MTLDRDPAEIVLLLLDVEEKIDVEAVKSLCPPGERVVATLRWSERGGALRPRAPGTNATTVAWRDDLPTLETMVSAAVERLREGASRRLVISACAPLPMMLYVGALLFGYARRVDVVSVARGRFPAARVPLDGPTDGGDVFTVDGLPSAPSSATGAVALYVSVAPLAAADDAPTKALAAAHLPCAAVVRAHPSSPLVVDDAVAPRAARQLAELVEHANQMFPLARDLAVFLRGPVSLAVALGRAINLATWHDVRFALHDGSDYSFPVGRARPRVAAGAVAARALSSSVTTILHVSDLHLRADDRITSYLQPLRIDLERRDHPATKGRVDHVVITGDLTNRATPEEFQNASRFVKELAHDLGLSLDRFVVVPGNHDLSWDVPVYAWRWPRQLSALREGSYERIEARPRGGLWRDPAEYPKRFANYAAHFYEPTFGRPWSLDASAQFEVQPSIDPRIAFVALNSACQIDEARPENVDLDEDALAEAAEQLRRARSVGRAEITVAAWHHPMSDAVRSSGALERLTALGAKLYLHGHVHEDRVEALSFLDATRRFYGVGAGTLGAPAADRPPSTPRLYNVVQIDASTRRARVHAFGAHRDRGTFTPYARWPGETADAPRNWYELTL